MDVQDRHTDILMAEPGIVGTGTGLNEHGRPAILVFAKSFELSRAAFIPSKIEGVPVVVKITGEFFALKKPTFAGGIFDLTARFDRPVPIGVSTGHPAITAGTIGCRVTDGTDVYALSNNHVYADQNDASTGDAVIQPGTYDGGSSPADNIGTLSAFEPIDFSGLNYIDAAIAISSTTNLGNATPSDGYGIPQSSTATPAINKKVMKYGRTTGLTKGSIYAINATVNVNYGTNGIARFVGQIVITPGSFSAGGDSGSLIVLDGKGSDQANKGIAVGLLFAGSSSYTIANPIDAVLDRFGVTVDDRSSSTNNPPTADFTYAPTSPTIDFTDTSSDSDGTVIGWSWELGDSNISTEQNPIHTYTANGTYTVTLTVTDDDSAIDSTSQGVTVDDGSGGCPDNDGDGFSDKECGGTDCDDNNRHVRPGHNDTKGRWGRDGVDNDCNGIIDG
jgi:PKD repeat protein